MKVFSRKGFVLLICVSLMNCNFVMAIKPKEKKYKISPFWCVIAAGVVALGVPAAVGAAGFGGAGMMSWTAIFSGGGVSSASLVAYLQSLGETGLDSFAMTAAGQVLMAVGCLSVILEEDELMKPQ